MFFAPKVRGSVGCWRRSGVVRTWRGMQTLSKLHPNAYRGLNWIVFSKTPLNTQPTLLERASTPRDGTNPSGPRIAYAPYTTTSIHSQSRRFQWPQCTICWRPGDPYGCHRRGHFDKTLFQAPAQRPDHHHWHHHLGDWFRRHPRRVVHCRGCQ